MIDEALEEQACGYALEALSPEERAAFQARLAHDRELQQLVAEYRDAAAQLAHLAPRRLPRPELQQRIARGLFPARQRSLAAAVWVPWALAASLAICTGALWWRQSQIAHRNEELRGKVAAAQTRADETMKQRDARLAAVEAELAQLRSERDSLTQRVAQLQQQEEQSRVKNDLLVKTRDSLQKKIDDLERADALSHVQVATLTSKLPGAPKAAATVIWDRDKQEGILRTANIPPNKPTQNYQLWIVDPAYKQPVDAGVFSVDESGQTRLVFRPKAPVAAANAFAVSLERKGGVPKAEGPMVVAGN